MEQTENQNRENIARYQRVLASLLDALLKSPHLRIGQLLVNLVEEADDLYYIDDFELERKIKIWLDEAR